MHMSVKQIDCAGSSIDFQWPVQYGGCYHVLSNMTYCHNLSNELHPNLY